ncbi:MAG: hypothetical protein EZS28_010421 [Streblomastix strix]|uniref:Uncharacterized protein n=1 Tax=Streblomastix strix TaxID=222440 RepID=A0A5J4WHK2_9EUKA|nr:MAG: hypothetical protein EZS28_010421 [Streblomastix strix]
MNTLKVNPRLSLQLLNAALAERDFALVGHILHEFHNLSHFTAESAIVGALRLLLRHFPSQIRPLMQFLEKIQSVTVNKRILSAIALLHMKILVLQSDFHQAGAVGQEYLTETSLIKSGTANLICALLGQEYGIWNEFVATFAIRRLYNALINCIEPTRKINILNNWAIGIKLERDLFAHKQTGSINAQDDNLQIDKFEQQLEKETFNQIQQIIAQSPNNQVQNADEKGIISAQEMAILCGRWLSAEPSADWPLLMLHWFWKNGIGDVCVSDIAYALVMRLDSAEIINNQNHNIRDRCNYKEVDLVLQAMNQDGNDSEHKKKQQQRINQLYEREIIRRKEQTRSEMIRDEEPIQEDELNDNQNNIDIQQQQTIESNTNIDDEQFIPLNEWVLLLEVLERLLILSGRKNIFDERLNDKIKDKQIKINNKQRQTKRFIIIRDDDSDEGEVNENINVEDIIQQDQQSIDQNSFGDVYNSSHIDMQLGKRGALEVLKTLQTLTSHWRSIHFKRRMTQVSISKTNENKDILEEEKEWEYFAQCIEEILNTDGLVTAVAKARVWQILFKQQEIYQSQSRDQYGLDYYDIIMRGYHEGWFDAVVDAERTASGADNCFNEDNKISLVQLLFKSFGIE